MDSSSTSGAGLPGVASVASRVIAGVGLGLRWELDEGLIETLPELDFLEVAPENYVERGGYHSDALAYLATHYPIVTHGLSMSLGGTDPLDTRYLDALRPFIASLGSPWHSDHLSFGTSRGRVLHDLLPVAFTTAGVRRIVGRIKRAQDALGVPLAVENISFYLPPAPEEMGEAEFIARVCEGAECGLLLDVNNLYVNATNFGFDAMAWLKTVPLERVTQLHVAGHEWFDASLYPKAAGSEGALIVDTHGADVPDPVLSLFAEVIARTGPRPVVLERDHQMPPLVDLLAEIARLKAIVASVVASRAPAEQRAAGP
jgi:uncharacterized protein (UPF0276 family)